MYMSRLAALKEYAFMTALRENGFPVPEPLAQSRHTIVMSLIDAFPMRQVASVPDPAGLYAELIAMILRLAQFGLIHGDFNEFNILLEERADESAKGGVALTPILIDFPQMVSVDHLNAEMYFDRDVQCIKTFFKRRFHFTPTTPGPFFSEARKLVATDGAKRLDVQVEASGFSRKMAKELEAYMKEVGVDGDAGEGAANHEEEGEGEEEDEEDEEGVEEEAEAEAEEEVEQPLPRRRDGRDIEYTTDALGNTVEVLANLKVDDKT
jgi:RIO kinase 2